MDSRQTGQNRGNCNLNPQSNCTDPLNLSSETLAEKSAHPISLGNSVAICHGASSNDATIVVTQNFLPPLRDKGGLHVQVDGDCTESFPLNFLAIPCAGSGEVPLTLTPQPGLLEYFHDIELIAPDQETLHVSPGANSRTTYPSHDPLSLVSSSHSFPSHLRGASFVSAFTSNFVRAQAEALGLNTPQTSDSFQTNDKRAFREAASRFGFSVAAGLELHSWNDVQVACSTFQDTPVWMKFSHAFGGSNLLTRIESPLTAEKLISARDMIRGTAQKAATKSQAGLSVMNRVWPDSSFGPSEYALVLEQDLGMLGEIVAIGSNLMTIANDGSHKTQAHFRQMISPTGEFLGSMIFSPKNELGTEIAAELEIQFGRIARYASEELSLFGIVGVDFMIIKSHEDDKLRAVMIELNGRPPISACSYIVGTQKLQAPAWISQYMWSPRPLNTVEDFEDLVNVGGANYSRGSSVDSGIVVPMHLSSLFRENSKGDLSLKVESNWAQVLIAGSSPEHCAQIQEALKRNSGVSFVEPK